MSCKFIYKAITSSCSCSCINVSSVVCSCALYIERKLEFSTGKRLCFLINLLNSDCICEESLIISVLTRIRRSTITKNWLYSKSVLITSTVDCCCVSNNTRIRDNELSAVLVKAIASFSFFCSFNSQFTISKLLCFNRSSINCDGFDSNVSKRVCCRSIAYLVVGTKLGSGV